MYDANTIFLLGVTGANLFNNVYVQDPIQVGNSGPSGPITINVSSIGPTDPKVSNVSVPPKIGETMTVTDKYITATTTNQRNLNLRFWCQSKDPYGSYAKIYSASELRMYDSYTNQSGALTEPFDDENYRLPSGTYDTIPGAITGQWSSSTALVNGQVAVWNGVLNHPRNAGSGGNFSTYLPSQSTDYSAYTADAVYYRAFYQNGTPHSNGILTFENLISTDIAQVGTGKINVELKLPSVTGWMDLGLASDGYSTGDGAGCRNSQDSNQWGWTANGGSTAYSGYMYILRITIRNAYYTSTISKITEVGW